MDERLRFIAACGEEQLSMAELCRQWGISRKTGYKWLQRYNELGPSGLEQRSPVASVFPHRVRMPSSIRWWRYARSTRSGAPRSCVNF
jgi:transposase-like protein